MSYRKARVKQPVQAPVGTGGTGGRAVTPNLFLTVQESGDVELRNLNRNPLQVRSRMYRLSVGEILDHFAENLDLTFAEMFDAGIVAPVDGDYLTYDQAAARWVNSPLPSILVDLSGLAYAGNALKALRVNASATSLEYVDLSALYQPLAANLTAFSGLSDIADRVPYFTGSGMAIQPFSASLRTWLSNPTSANLRAFVADETGTGALVFANTPTLVTPNIGAATGTSLDLSAGGGSISIATNQQLWLGGSGAGGYIKQLAGGDLRIRNSVAGFNEVGLSSSSFFPAFAGVLSLGTAATEWTSVFARAFNLGTGEPVTFDDGTGDYYIKRNSVDNSIRIARAASSATFRGEVGIADTFFGPTLAPAAGMGLGSDTYAWNALWLFENNSGSGDTAKIVAPTLAADIVLTTPQYTSTLVGGVAAYDGTALTAVASSALHTPDTAGFYRVSVTMVCTRAATTSSIMGASTRVTYTPVGAAGLTTLYIPMFAYGSAALVGASGISTNFVDTILHGSVVVYAAAGTAITYYNDYTSVGATSMRYNTNVRLEKLNG